MIAAIYLKKNNVVCKTTNLQKKLKKEKDEIQILEQWEFDDDLNKMDERFKFWNSQYIVKKKDDEEDIILHHFKNIKTGHTITSIYDHLNNIPDIVLDEWIQED